MLDKIIVHRLHCDICDMDGIEDLGENYYAKDMRKWAKEAGWGFHKGKDYCPLCEGKYIKDKNVTKL